MLAPLFAFIVIREGDGIMARRRWRDGARKKRMECAPPWRQGRPACFNPR